MYSRNHPVITNVHIWYNVSYDTIFTKHSLFHNFLERGGLKLNLEVKLQKKSGGYL
jgi:hypothetical protein